MTSVTAKAGRYAHGVRAPRSLLLIVVSSLLALSCAVEQAGQPPITTAPATTPAPTAGSTTTATTTTTIATTTTEAVTVTTSTAEPERQRLVIHAVGDVNLDGRYIPDLRSEGWDLAFGELDGIFQRDDLTIVNLECDPSEIGAPLSNKEFAFRCDRAGLPSLVRSGVDVAGMGNNHAADYGFDSLIDGRANLEAAGLNPVGAGADLAEANEPRIFEIGGWTIGVVAFSGTSGLTYGGAYPKSEDLINPWFATEDTPGIAPATTANMTAVVSALDARVDVVIVSLHQGEYNETFRPGPLEVERIHTLVAAGADVVVAHHHHRVLPFEYIESVPIFWGMGNFVWRRLDPERNTSAIAEIVLEPDGTVTGRLIPAFIERPGRPVLRGLPDPAVRSDREKLA